MAYWHLEQLELDPDQVERRISFLNWYADLIDFELDQAEVAQDEPVQGDEQWMKSMEGSHAKRRAAQLSLLVDTERARTAIDRAGRRYGDLGVFFGTFLRAVAQPDPGQATIADSLVHNMTRAEDLAGVPPQQAVYAFLSAAATGDEYQRDSLLSLASSSDHRHGVAPVGALGIPMYRYWAVGLAMLGVEPETVALEHLQVMCGKWAQAIEAAQLNRYLWANVATPVDIGDIDLIGTTTLAMRAMGAESMHAALTDRLFGNGAIPVDLAFDLATGQTRG